MLPEGWQESTLARTPEPLFDRFASAKPLQRHGLPPLDSQSAQTARTALNPQKPSMGAFKHEVDELAHLELAVFVVIASARRLSTMGAKESGKEPMPLSCHKIDIGQLEGLGPSGG